MLLIPILLPLAGAIALFFIKDDRTRRPADLVMFVSAAVAILIALFGDGTPLDVMNITADTALTFSIDPLSRFFMVLIAFIFGMVHVYSPDYMHHEGGESRFYGFYALTLAFLNAVCMAHNIITFYMCFEFMTLASMPLVLHNGTDVSRQASFKYLGYSTLGASLALLGAMIVYNCADSMTFTAGGVNIAPGCEKLMLTAYFLMFIGFGAKAGLAPLQMWLTEAHPVAPSPASAVLSGIITKTGVLAIMRMTFFYFGIDLLAGSWPQKLLTVIALCTIFMGSMLAFKEKVLKKRMAYSTISNVSYVLFGILTLNSVGFSGSLLQVVFHALAKDALFLAAGAIIFATGFTRVEQLRGIGRRMPVTMWCFTLAALSLIGIPPLGGFVSKWYLCLGGLEAGQTVGITGMTVLMVSALLTAFYLLSISASAFFPGKDFESGEKCEVTSRMLTPMAVFAAILIILGLFPNGLINIISAICGTLM